MPRGETAPLSSGTRAMLWQPAVGPSRDFFHFGFWNGGRTLVTSGNLSGANAHLAVGRDDDIVVAVTVNQTGNDADEAAGQIVDLLLPPSPGAPDIRAAYAALHQTPYGASAGLMGHWSGTVATEDANRPIALDARSDSVLVRLGNAAWAPLERPRLSAFGELRGSLTADIAGLSAPDSGPTRIDVALKWEGTQLRGYLLVREASAQPYAVQLTRAP